MSYLEQLEDEKAGILKGLFRTRRRGLITDPAEKRAAERLSLIEWLLKKLRHDTQTP